MQKTYTTPAGKIYRLYGDMLAQPHLLIAGATGSGKSVVINGIISTALYSSPASVRFILIDLKRVELSEYRRIPHILTYADDIPDAIAALQSGLDIIETRYKDMQRRKLRTYDGSDVYIVIDELADLMTTAKREVTPMIQRLCQIGRAARVHVIAATQCPISAVIPTPIKVNFDSRVALRTRSAQDSRNILGLNGCEKLPRYGMGYYLTPDEFTLYQIPMIDDAERQRLIDHWTAQSRPGFFSRFRRPA